MWALLHSLLGFCAMPGELWCRQAPRRTCVTWAVLTFVSNTGVELNGACASTISDPCYMVSRGACLECRAKLRRSCLCCGICTSGPAPGQQAPGSRTQPSCLPMRIASVAASDSNQLHSKLMYNAQSSAAQPFVAANCMLQALFVQSRHISFACVLLLQPKQGPSWQQRRAPAPQPLSPCCCRLHSHSAPLWLQMACLRRLRRLARPSSSDSALSPLHLGCFCCSQGKAPAGSSEGPNAPAPEQVLLLRTVVAADGVLEALAQAGQALLVAAVVQVIACQAVQVHLAPGVAARLRGLDGRLLRGLHPTRLLQMHVFSAAAPGAACQGLMGACCVACAPLGIICCAMRALWALELRDACGGLIGACSVACTLWTCHDLCLVSAGDQRCSRRWLAFCSLCPL